MYYTYTLYIYEFLELNKHPEIYEEVVSSAVCRIITEHKLSIGDYNLKITPEYWTDYKFNEEIDKLRVHNGLYSNVIGKSDTQFISRRELEDYIKNLKPFDIKVEIKSNDVNRDELFYYKGLYLKRD